MPIDTLQKQLPNYPKLPGVYLMKDEKAEVIYIGKAKNLRSRVGTYFAGGDGRAQIQFLLKRIDTIETIVTENEEQAFILERDLITKYKPRYNIRLKDDKSYLSVRIDPDEPWPRLELVRRRPVEDTALYFGPYTFSYELRELLEMIKKVVPLRSCTNTVFFNRQRPCLEYQIKRCAGPCCIPVDRQEYGRWVKQAISILEGKTEPLEKELSKQMERASEDLRFEDAALMRDRLEILKHFKSGQRLIAPGGENKDVFAFYREETLAALTILQMRNGRIAETVNFSFADVQVPDCEVVESAIEQFYESNREIPEEIVIPMDLENASFIIQRLRERRGSSVEVTVPERGLKARLLGLAQVNAHEHFKSKFDLETRNQEIAKSLAKLCRLRQMPRRIECVDISNLQGSDIVGAIVTFMDGAPDKKNYRKYKLSFQDKPDDFAAINEVVSRRLQRGAQENDLPDLLIIDGGQGQLNAALAAREACGAALDIVSLAKMRAGERGGQKSVRKPERIFVEGGSESMPLDPQSEVTHFLERIRDEVHRFVITFHRTKRSQRVLMSALDEIPGVGPERRRRLFQAFGSIEKMKEASVEELAKEGRMPAALAEKILVTIRGQCGNSCNTPRPTKRRPPL